MLNNLNIDLERDVAPAATLMGLSAVFYGASYALDAAIPNFALNAVAAVLGGIYGWGQIFDNDAHQTEWGGLATFMAAGAVAVNALWGTSSILQDRKVCFVGPEEVVAGAAGSAYISELSVNERSAEANKAAAAIIFQTAGSEGGQALPYTTEPSAFAEFRDSARACPKVGREAANIFNAEGFDQVGAVEQILATWEEKYVPTLTVN